VRTQLLQLGDNQVSRSLQVHDVALDGDFSNLNSLSARRAQLQALNDEWLALMRAGQFSAAWCVSDAALRLRSGIDCSQWPRHEQFIWRGASLAGKRVLIRCYHGLGDTLQFVRFAARTRARQVTLWVQPKLIQLLRSMPGIDRLEPLHDGTPALSYDVDVELAELMHVLRVTPDVLASELPYLNVPPAELPRTGHLRVGIVWAAGDWDPRRSLSCESLAVLRELRGGEWDVLQRGPALREWPHDFGTIPKIENIVDEARVLRALDLLITVDTCSAHLAGALGVPVWTLLRHDADWRWMVDRSDTPWYPTMRLIRQRRADDWTDVLRTVVRDLGQLAAQVGGASDARS
jgi:hypothetical protein